MNKLDFYLWVMSIKMLPKKYSDTISRLQQIEKSIKNCDLDNEFNKDKCQSLLELFKNLGRNINMSSLHIGTLPIGKKYMTTYSAAVRQFIKYKESLKTKI